MSVTTQTCYHCNKEFDAEPDDSIVYTWVCPGCGGKLVEDAVVDDERATLKVTEIVTDPINYFRGLNVTTETVWVALVGYFFLYIGNGLQQYTFESDLGSHLNFIVLAGLFFGSWVSFLVYGGFLHIAAKIVGGTAKFTRTATALGHAVLLPAFVSVLFGILWVSADQVHPWLIAAGYIACGLLTVILSIAAIKAVNQLSWIRAVVAWLLLPLATIILGVSLALFTTL
jgi:hypothetical protein